jgi:act minimal PKS acyl carrier protein
MINKNFTVDDLRQALLTCAGKAADVDLDGEIADIDFADLGYDSLALIETSSFLARRLAIGLPEDALAETPTPRRFVELINASLTAA